jgi:recombination protein RecT
MSNEIGPQNKTVEKFKAVLNMESVAEQFQNALQKQAGPFTASLVEMFSADEMLQKCNHKDLVMEALKAASLKLPINKNLGYAWIIPRKEKGVLRPNFQIGYRGYIQLAMRTGKYKYINADIIPAGWEVETLFPSGEMKFIPGDSKEEEPAKGYFAYFELLNGFKKTIYRSREWMEKHMQEYAKGYDTVYSPWKKDFDGMAVKTVLSHLLSKYGYLSIEMVNAFTGDSDQSPDEKADTHASTIDIDVNEVNEAPDEQESENQIPEIPEDLD